MPEVSDKIVNKVYKFYMAEVGSPYGITVYSAAKGDSKQRFFQVGINTYLDPGDVKEFLIKNLGFPANSPGIYITCLEGKGIAPNATLETAEEHVVIRYIEGITEKWS